MKHACLIISLWMLGAVLPFWNHGYGQSTGTPAEDAVLDQFAWMEGAWVGDLDIGRGIAKADVHYFAPEAGSISGSFRLTFEGETLVLELASIVANEDEIEFRLRHFSKSLDPWEGDEPIVLTLESATDTLFTFRNHVNDNPRWSYLQPLDGDRFRAWSEIFDEEGSKSVIDIEYARAAPVTPR